MARETRRLRNYSKRQKTQRGGKSKRRKTTKAPRRPKSQRGSGREAIETMMQKLASAIAKPMPDDRIGLSGCIKLLSDAVSMKLNVADHLVYDDLVLRYMERLLNHIHNNRGKVSLSQDQLTVINRSVLTVKRWILERVSHRAAKISDGSVIPGRTIIVNPEGARDVTSTSITVDRRIANKSISDTVVDAKDLSSRLDGIVETLSAISSEVTSTSIEPATASVEITVERYLLPSLQLPSPPSPSSKEARTVYPSSLTSSASASASVSAVPAEPASRRSISSTTRSRARSRSPATVARSRSRSRSRSPPSAKTASASASAASKKVGSDYGSKVLSDQLRSMQRQIDEFRILNPRAPLPKHLQVLDARLRAATKLK